MPSIRLHVRDYDAHHGGTWDVRGPEHKPVITVKQLVEALGNAESPIEVQKERVRQFIQLRAALAMPTPLRRDVAKWLDGE